MIYGFIQSRRIPVNSYLRSSLTAERRGRNLWGLDPPTGYRASLPPLGGGTPGGPPAASTKKKFKEIQEPFGS